MPLKVWRFTTFMLTAVALAAAVSHLLELPAKMNYDASLYLMLHRTFAAVAVARAPAAPLSGTTGRA